MQEIEPLNGTRGSRSIVRKYLDSRAYTPWILTRAYFRKTERRITFQRGDLIRFDRNNDIILGSIENIFVHEVLAGDRRLFIVARPATVEKTSDNISGAVLGTIGTSRFIVGLPAIRDEQIYAVPVDEISGRLTLGTMGNTRAGDKFLLVDFSISFL